MSLNSSSILALTTPSGYQKLKADITQTQKQAWTVYDRTFARNDAVLKLIEVIEADLLEIKKNQQLLMQSQLPPSKNAFTTQSYSPEKR